ncbi:lysophospholipid acyltransferase family protein [Roseicyclus persicicus]|uniref:1-acyl-sn-glycerol-3-phosphate acyltransferase n=1 Tax=Roseicyclus persicicus TaxID=2650661 RepID=A0A7X6K0M0_9RHOB|nr:lysophospholipid acyltransferase family protein [Roseibacterium persicicum]NKX46018.1 1-acyl-sn-glycerol-3-phosphate acyltransferase [Roseibacterium persicicum]
MSPTWHGLEEPAPRPMAPGDWLRVGLRGAAILALLAVCFPLLLVLRIPERLICGLNRPVTPHITQFVCRAACRVLGLRLQMRGAPMTGPGAYVANHVSWLDIFVLNACKRLYFVAKSEVAGWPGIGWLARGTGTVFIDRDRRQAAAQTRLFEDRLRAGHRLLFFPEGTSTDGRRVLPFKTTLFQAFQSDRLRDVLQVQPVTVVYHPPPGEADTFYGWWGDMPLGPAILSSLAVRRQGRVEVVYHTPLRVADFPDRKTLAAMAEAEVRGGFPPERLA